MIKKSLGAIYANHKDFWSKETAVSFLRALLILCFALLIQNIAYYYVDYRVQGTWVGDLFLNNLPAFNLDFFIVQWALILTLLVLALQLLYPRYLPFTLKALALFLIIRSFFITLTHLGADLHQITLNPETLGFGLYDFLYNSKNDYFFSGHTGASFLMGLIFWREKFWRYFFFASSFVMGASMLLSHMHYSIDVFAAPFITYAIFAMAKYFFATDYALLKKVKQ